MYLNTHDDEYMNLVTSTLKTYLDLNSYMHMTTGVCDSDGKHYNIFSEGFW